jgi:hypothetical protein
LVENKNVTFMMAQDFQSICKVGQPGVVVFCSDQQPYPMTGMGMLCTMSVKAPILTKI